jgi:hypothetical protein
MKHFRKLLVAVAATGAAATVLALTASGGASAPATRGATRTLQFLSVTVAQRFVPATQLGNNRRSQIGGRLIFNDVTYNRAPPFGKPSDARIGSAEGICTIVSDSKPAAQCVITAHVPDGQIVVAGEGDPGAKVTRYAVVGGIGAYGNARGTVTATSISQDKTLIVVHLSS